MKLKDLLKVAAGNIIFYVESDANDYNCYKFSDKRYYKETELTEEIKDLTVVEVSPDECDCNTLEIYLLKGE